jgi:hypothetical protein
MKASEIRELLGEDRATDAVVELVAQFAEYNEREERKLAMLEGQQKLMKDLVDKLLPIAESLFAPPSFSFPGVPIGEPVVLVPPAAPPAPAKEPEKDSPGIF